MSKTYTITDRVEPTRLTAEESLKMAHAIFEPREPSAHTRAAAKRYLASIEAK